MERDHGLKRLANEKGAQTFFFATKMDLAECIDNRKKVTGKARLPDLRPSGRSLLLKAQIDH
ncbi:MAG: hypothetical protein HQL75_15525 [Magnetococcales bacterium]|nr:hypothetical protein [Magnetococcales bacterium]